MVRLSGPEADAIAAGLLDTSPTRPREAVVARLVDSQGEMVDRVLATRFPKPRSYTAEDVVEISCHGSPAVLSFAVERALELGARLGEPGEFTMRAFRNGRVDLPQAEAVRDLIDATTLYQARVAAQQTEGALSRRLAPLKKRLTDLIALLEAGIDFAEDDLEVASNDQIRSRLAPLRAEVQRLAASYEYGKVVRGGLTLAIIGRPNVGKSSLFNRLLEQDRAIVNPQAGTTRDVVSEYLEIDGIPVRLLDTAGIRATSDVVEAEGVERSYAASADADLVLAVVDLSEPLTDVDRALLTRAATASSLVVGNKRDLAEDTALDDCIAVSAKTGEGIVELRSRIRQLAAPESETEQGFITNLRHSRLLEQCGVQLAKAHGAVNDAVPHEMLLLDLYGALRPLDAITGATTVDDILGTIFSSFCIGK